MQAAEPTRRLAGVLSPLPASRNQPIVKIMLNAIKEACPGPSPDWITTPTNTTSGDAQHHGEELTIGHVTVLFSDLKGSSALYERIGDAAAYRLVRSHFTFLTRVI